MDNQQHLKKGMRFFWRLIQGGETGNGVITRNRYGMNSLALPDLEQQIKFCTAAENCGIEGLLVDINYAKPDPILLATALAYHSKKIKFIVAVRSGLLSPTLFTQQVNTFSYLSGGRILLNVVAGHSPKEQKYYGDFLPHDERYDRTGEFMEICRAFWNKEGEVNFSGKYFKISNGLLNTHFQGDGQKAPYVFIAGGSAPARHLAIQAGDCWMQLANSPSVVGNAVKPVLDHGLDIGLRMSVIARPTRAEALEVAQSIIQIKEQEQSQSGAEDSFVKNSDSHSIKKTYQLSDTEWLTDTLWTGAIRHYGAPCIALVGSYEEVASAFMDYKNAGATQFILSGWPKLGEMLNFGKKVLPLIREKEQKQTNYATTNNLQL